MKRILSLVLAMVMVLGSFSAVFAAEQTAAEKAGAFLKNVEVLLGNETGLNLGEDLRREEAIVVLSRLMGVEETAKGFPTEGLKFTDITNEGYKGYIQWAVANELTNGKSETKFGFKEPLTAQHFAMFVLRALGYGDVEYANAFEKAVELGILADVDAKKADTLVRGDMAVMTVNALSVKVKDSAKTLAETLNIEMPVVEVPVVEATKVESVYAENLKEVVVVFNGEVDAATAEDENNYAISGVTFESAELSEDATTVVLSTTNALTNQKEYELTVSKVKAGAAVLATEKVKFTTLDNTLPQVVEVKALGTKVVKVIVSEPVKLPLASNFKLDGKTYFGAISVDGRVITLKPYSAAAVLTTGDHTLEIIGLTDYFNLKSLKQELKFVVVEDKAAPTIVEVTATLERAVVTFDEDIDPDTVNKNNFYWKSGTTKMYPASATLVGGNKVVLDFNNNKLPAYETSLYVINVADYSGNKMVETATTVKAVVDESRPEVVDVVKAKNNTDFTVKFSKAVTAADRSYYSFKDKDGKVLSVKQVTGSGKEFVVSLYSALPQGVNTLTISGAADTTTLKNVMLPQTFEFTVGDTTAPIVSSVAVNNKTIIVTFSEEMEIATIVDANNYLVEVGGNWMRLPSGTNFNVYNSGRVVLINLPEKINDKTVIYTGVATSEQVLATKIQVLGAKDLAGNAISITTNTIAEGPANVVSSDVYLKSEKSIEIKFDQVITNALKDGVVVNFNGVPAIAYTVSTNGTNLVTVNFDESVGTDGYKVASINIVPQTLTVNNFATLTGGNVASASGLTVVDKVAPKVTAVALKAGGTDKIDVTFSENINIVTGSELDFEITRVSDNKVLTIADFTVTGSLKVATITINSPVDSLYTVKLKAAQYTKDVNGNKAVESDLFEVVGVK